MRIARSAPWAAALSACVVSTLVLWPSAGASASVAVDESPVPAHRADNGLPPCTIVGTAGPDRLVGTPGADVICGRGGADVILAGGGDDLVLAGRGRDRVVAGDGDDRVDGGDGADVIKGGGGADRLYGMSGDDRIEGGPDQDVIVGEPVPNFLPWTALLVPSFDLPAGTVVRLNYDPPSGNCLQVYNSFAITTPASPTLLMFLTTAVSSPLESCAYERSYGTWNIAATTPRGVIGTGRLYITSGVPNPVVHTLAVACVNMSGMSCTAGPASVGSGLTVTTTVKLGPMDRAEPEPGPGPTAPSLSCVNNIRVTPGEALDSRNSHICTLEGNPRPDFRVSGLPEGVSLRRWPTANDTWLVLNGSIAAPGGHNITVTAELPGGWSQTRTVTVESYGGDPEAG